MKKAHAECETLPCGVVIHKREDDKPKMNTVDMKAGR